jgi:hypothetical protein
MKDYYNQMNGNNREERYYFGDYEIYRKFTSDTLATERTTVNISEPVLREDEGNKSKIATVDALKADEGSLKRSISKNFSHTPG